jgi:hypothetical protein
MGALPLEEPLANATLPAPHEVLVPYRAPRDKLGDATGVRSTLLASSLRSLRGHGLYDVYLARVDPAWREAILDAVAGIWLPIDAALAHYRACDTLGLTPAQQMEIGREVGDRVHGTFLGTMIRSARTAGVTPWTALGYTGKLYERLFVGGGACVLKVGPKDARCELAGNPLVDLTYFRNAFRGLYQVGVELFCTKAYVVEIPRASTPGFCALKISWA